MENDTLKFGRYNTKIKSYRDGSCTMICCDTPIFMPENELIVTLEDDPVAINAMWAAGKRKENAERKEKINKILADKGIERTESVIHKDSMKRAIDKVYDIAFQNEWAYFLTCTINKENGFDRNDPIAVYDKLHNWLKNKVTRNGLQYLAIPEYHPESGEGIHIHALVNDVLKRVDSGRVLFKDGKAWRRDDLVRRGVDVSAYKTIYNVPQWKYGFTTAIPVSGSPAALACYITKYITKDCKKIFGKYYLSSRNICRKADVICCNTDEFNTIERESVTHGGMSFKYQSDFNMQEDSGRNPTEEILKYLSEKGVKI
mgnify:CR=1 FL=1